MTDAGTTGALFYVTGSSQTGKSEYVRRRVKDAPQILAWDPKHEWCKLRGMHAVNVRELALLSKRGALRTRIAVLPTAGDLRKQFEVFAAVAWILAKYYGPAVIIADELSAVTSPGKASPNWHRLISQSLYLNPTIYAITQRAAESDKTAIGNATDVVTFRQVLASDRAYMARALDVDVALVAALRNYHALHRDQGTGDLYAVGPRKTALVKP